MKSGFLLASLTLVLSGCATDGPIYNSVRTEAPPDRSQIVFYRDSAGVAGAAWPHHYFIDNRLVAELKIGGFSEVTISPGTHTIQTGPTSNPGFRSRALNALAGRTYFFRERGTVPTDFSIVPPDEAQRELGQGYRFQAPMMSSSN